MSYQNLAGLGVKGVCPLCSDQRERNRSTLFPIVAHRSKGTLSRFGVSYRTHEGTGC